MPVNMASSNDANEAIEDALNSYGWNDVLVLRSNQIDHFDQAAVDLIHRLQYEDVPADSVADRRLEWLVDLDVVTIEESMVKLRCEVVVFEPLVSP